MFNFFKKKPKNNSPLNALNESTWNLASDKVFEWEGQKIKSGLDGDNYASEKKIIEFLDTFIRLGNNNYEFQHNLKRAGKINVITHILDRLTCGMHWGEAMRETIHWVNNCNPNERGPIFDISDISTWEFASEQYIIYDNRLVYDKNITHNGKNGC
jgi:hypothetical protein